MQKQGHPVQYARLPTSLALSLTLLRFHFTCDTSLALAAAAGPPPLPLNRFPPEKLILTGFFCSSVPLLAGTGSPGDGPAAALVGMLGDAVVGDSDVGCLTVTTLPPSSGSAPSPPRAPETLVPSDETGLAGDSSIWGRTGDTPTVTMGLTSVWTSPG